MQIGAWPRFLLLAVLLPLTTENLTGCSLLHPERVLYDQQGIRIGVEPDPTATRADNQAVNNHPANITATDIRSLLQVVQVSGWSGTLTGLFVNPQLIPLFTAQELSTIPNVIATAFREAKPTERVFFSLPKPGVAYSEDRTAGSLFLRGRYLHIVVTDHSAFLQADTAGGDLKDIRDTKGMKLWVAGPVQPATVPDAEEPRWGPFETVHISLNVKEVLAQQAKTPPVHVGREPEAPPATAPAPAVQKNAQAGVSTEDLHLQIRELTSSNLELRSRLEEQTKRMEQLNQQMEQLRLELETARAKKPPSRKSPAQ